MFEIYVLYNMYNGIILIKFPTVMRWKIEMFNWAAIRNSREQ